MNKDFCLGIDNLLDVFEDVLSPAEVLSAKLTSQISSAITKERISLEMTQAEFAKYINVTQSQVSRWERGDYNFSLKKVAEISSKLNLDIDITFTNNRKPSKKESYSEQSSNIIEFPKRSFYNSDNIDVDLEEM